MKKKKLNLANAIKAYKKGKENRQISQTETQIERFIDEQIKLKKEEIEEINETLAETLEERNDDFEVSLLELDERCISTRQHRKDIAQEYVSKAVGLLKSRDSYKESNEEQIELLRADIKYLEELRAKLETLEVEVESEE